MKKTMICRTKDTAASFSLIDSVLYLESMTLSGVERAVKSQISLPAAYQNKNGETVPFVWAPLTAEKMSDGWKILFHDAQSGLSYRIDLKGREDICGPIEFSAVMTNPTAEQVRIFPAEIFSAVFAFDNPPTAWTFMKESGVAENVYWRQNPDAFFPGTGIYKDTVSGDVTVCAETNTNQNFNIGGKIPIIYLDGQTAGAYIAFEWASSRIFASAVDGGVRVSVDLHENFTTRVPAGGDFIVPPIYLGVYHGDIEDGSNIFKRWFFLEKTPKTVLKNENEPLVQTDTQFIPSRVGDLGIQSIKWDYGWWEEKRGSLADWTTLFYEGSWHLRQKGMLWGTQASNLAEYGDYLHSLGLNWTVYILLHDSRAVLEGDDHLTSIGPTARPEWFCHVADLGNEECASYCKRKLYDFFTSNHADTWRSDFEPIACASYRENRHDANGNDVQYWCSRGFYDIADYLIESIPGFRYESCSSGGSMKDYATMHRAAVFNNDDSANWMSLRTTFYDSSYCFPPAQLLSPTNPDTFCPDSDSHYAGVGDKHMGMRALIMGAVSLGSWSGPDGNGHLQYGLEDFYREYLPLHNEKVKPLIRHANLYHTLPRPDHVHWDGMQYGCDFIPENKIGGALFLFKPTNQNEPTIHVSIRGLNPELTYRADFYERKDQSFTATGAELMENGLDCTIAEEFGSEIVFFEIV